MIRSIRTLLVAACLLNAVAMPLQAAAASALAPQPSAEESFDSGMLHVDRYGSGTKTLIFIPGLASGTWTWYEQIAHFSPDYTVYAITLPGFDGRAASTEPDLFAAFSRDFFAMLDSRHIDKPVVVGHSLGGTLAISLAEQHPEKLGAIVAVDGLPVFPTVAQSTPEQRQAAAAGMAAGIAGVTHAQMLAYQKQFMSTIGTVDTSFAPALANLTAKSDPKAVAAWVKEDVSTDLRADLSKITIPFMEVMPYASPSPYSQADTLSFYQMLVTGAPHVEVVTVSPARHYAMLDQPEKFDAALTQFLAKVQR
ncbi:MAG: alpha/beta hydrolase [Candidatus Baltobacteraceae bacterium]